MTVPTVEHGEWTFFGHWDNDRIVVDYAMTGDVEDARIDVGTYEQGLWAASATGETIEQAQAAAITYYENGDA